MNRDPARPQDQALQPGGEKSSSSKSSTCGGIGLPGSARITDLPRPPLVYRRAGNEAVSQWVQRQNRGKAPPSGTETPDQDQGLGRPGSTGMVITVGATAGGAVLGALAGATLGALEAGLGAAAGAGVGLTGALLARLVKRQRQS